MQRVPGKRRALHARGKFAHAGEHLELAERLLATAFGASVHHVVEVVEECFASASVLPFSASVISDADAVEIAQPAPSNATSSMIAVVDLQVDA